MDKNTKSFLIKSLIATLAGGGLAAWYNFREDRKQNKVKGKFNDHEIVIPLSRETFTKVLKPRVTASKSKDTVVESADDVQAMTPAELARYKKSILNKKATAASNIKAVDRPMSAETSLNNQKGTYTTYLRDKKGRFTTTKKLSGKTEKSASQEGGGIGYDTTGFILDGLGVVGGLAVGASVVKLIADKIQLNKQKKEMEAARRDYVKLINYDINNPEFYYKKAQATVDGANYERGTIGKGLGALGLTALLTAGTTAVIAYRLIENRRKAKEQEALKSKYPQSKIIKFQLTDDTNKQNSPEDILGLKKNEKKAGVLNDLFGKIKEKGAVIAPSKIFNPFTGEPIFDIDHAIARRALDAHLSPDGGPIEEAYSSSEKKTKKTAPGGSSTKGPSRDFYFRKFPTLNVHLLRYLSQPEADDYLAPIAQKYVKERLGSNIIGNTASDFIKHYGKTPTGKEVIRHKIVNELLPTLNGSKHIARVLASHGGNVIWNH